MHRKLYFFFLLLASLPLVSLGQQIPNSGFEQWEQIGNISEPVHWSTIKTCDNPGMASVAPVTYDTSLDAHSGNYALKLFNLEVFNLSATGAITNGRFHAEFDLSKSYSYTAMGDPQFCLPFTGRPDSLVGWFKFFPQGNDACQFKVIIHVDSCKLPENGTMPNWVAVAAFKSPKGVTYDTWTRFAIPFDYFDGRTPEYLLCTLNSGDSTSSVPDSYMILDDIELKYGPSGINENSRYEDFLAANGRSLVIDLKSEEEYLNQRFLLIDMSGQVVFAEQLNSNNIVIPDNVKQGIYIAALEGKKFRYTQKVMIR
jgi:hypothetical protein